MRSKLFNWYPLSISWARSVSSTILIISSDNSHLSSITNWLLLLNNLSLISSELRYHSVFFNPVSIIAWSSNLLTLIVILLDWLLDILYYFFNFLLSILVAGFFFNYFILLFIFIFLLLFIMNFRSISLRCLFSHLSFNCSCFNFFYWFTFFKSPYFNLSLFFNSDSFSLNFSFLEFFFSFNCSECFLLGSCSFISQFLDFILFNHFFSFNSLDNRLFFFFNFFKFLLFS